MLVNKKLVFASILDPTHIVAQGTHEAQNTHNCCGIIPFI